METDYLILKRASTSRPSGEWNDDDYDVLAVDAHCEFATHYSEKLEGSHTQGSSECYR